MPNTPFGAPSAAPSSSKKAIAPISANAFGFSFATPSKPVSTRRPDKTPRLSTSRTAKSIIPDKTPRPGPLEASSSRAPFIRLSETPLRAVKKEDYPTPGRSQFRLNDLSNPFLPPRPSDAPVKGKRKLNEVLNGDSPFRAHPPPTNPYEGKELRGLSNLQDVVRFDTIQEYSETERIKAEEEEGVGVSPRRVKGMSKWGRTPASLSKRLTDLLSAETSAILLFYTSLQHAVAPARPPPVRASNRPSFPQPDLPIPVVKLPSLAAHIRTAPLRLSLISPVRGRTQYSHMWLCQVIQWPAETPTVDYRGEELVDTRGAPAELLCVFQTLPSDCPRIGLDPRILASRFEDGQGSQAEGSRWEVGVWSPWRDTDLVTEIILGGRLDEEPAGRDGDGGNGGGVASQEWPEDDEGIEHDAASETLQPNASEAVEAEVVEEGNRPDGLDEEPLGEKKITKVLFASRYIIAER